MEYEVRRLAPGDEQLALEVVRHLIPEDERQGRQPTIQHLARFLAEDTNYLIVALVDGVPVGFLTAYRMPYLGCDANMVYIFEVAVAHLHRRRGLGKKMINLLKALCQVDTVEDILVGTENDNTAAKGLYESTGGVCTYPDQCEYTYQLDNTYSSGLA